MSSYVSSAVRVVLISVLLVGLALRSECTVADEHDRPNVIVVLTDDQGVQVRRGERKNGPWHIEVARPGRYEFRLRRWPEEVDAPLRGMVPAHDGEDGDYPAGVALPIVAARLTVGDHNAEIRVSPTDREACFVIELPAGRTTLQTWFLDDQQ